MSEKKPEPACPACRKEKATGRSVKAKHHTCGVGGGRY